MISNTTPIREKKGGCMDSISEKAGFKKGEMRIGKTADWHYS